ncbi:MAG: SUMF1/EgtB/PvdO family nonheme iron enzyme [Planctomycetota bacterium]|nr:SUMF1/EgtB/PvdO family nonheme iron enzyme [Planctomycetota bacterium]
MAGDGETRGAESDARELVIELPTAGEEPALQMRFCPIPAKGRRFRMGERGGSSDAEPVHEVELTEDFWLGTYVVTQGEYRAIVRWLVDQHENRSDGKAWDESPCGKAGDDRLPVGEVTWFDAAEWCNGLSRWLAAKGPGLRACLPSEIEWEYACRAGAETEYWNGDGEEALEKVGWYTANAGGKIHPVDEPVGGGDATKEANAFGLVGMHGNVDECCGDVYEADAYTRDRSGATRSFSDLGTERIEGALDRLRVIRGGAWRGAAGGCRSAFRSRSWPGDRLGDRGFRVSLVRGPAAEKKPGGGGAAGGRQRAEGEQAESDKAGGARPPSAGAGEPGAIGARVSIPFLDEPGPRAKRLLSTAAERSSAAGEKNALDDESVSWLRIGTLRDPEPSGHATLDFSLFPNLTHLFLWNLFDLERITGLPKSLVCLDLRKCAKLKSLPAAKLPNLETLDLGGCRSLESVPDFKTTRLRWVHFDGCEAIDAGDPHALNDILKDCDSLEELTLVDCPWVTSVRLPSQPATYPDGWTPVGDSRFPPRRLKKLVLRGCTKLPNLPPDLEGYRWLHHLDLRGCTTLEKMPALPVGKAEGRPMGVRTLYATGCEKMTSFRGLDIRRVHRGEGTPVVAGATAVEGRPRNVAGQFRTLARLAEDPSVELQMAKVLFLGSGRCGKTTVSKALAWKAIGAQGRAKPENKGLRPSKGELSTSNIRLDELHMPSGRAEPTTVHVWDFGGQEIYHNTHRLFASEGTVFVIVTTHRDTHTARLDKEIKDRRHVTQAIRLEEFEAQNTYRELEYWLDYVWEARGLKRVEDYRTSQRRPRVLIVFTGAAEDGNRRSFLVEDYVKQQAGRYRDLIGRGKDKIPVFPLTDIDAVDYDSDYGELAPIEKEVVAHAAAVADELGIRMPKLYGAMAKACSDVVRDNMAKRARLLKQIDKPLAMEAWQKLVAKHHSGLTPAQLDEVARAIAEYLHECGRVYFRPRPRLPPTVIVDQQWAIDLVYKVVVKAPADLATRRDLYELTRTPFSVADLKNLIGDDVAADDWDFLLPLLDACDIVIDLGQGKALATHPGLLGPLDPDTEERLAREWRRACDEASRRGTRLVNHSFAIQSTGKGLLLSRSAFQQIAVAIARHSTGISWWLESGANEEHARSELRKAVHHDLTIDATACFWQEGVQITWQGALWSLADTSGPNSEPTDVIVLRIQWAHTISPAFDGGPPKPDFTGGIFVQMLCSKELTNAARLRELLFGSAEPNGQKRSASHLGFDPPLGDFTYSDDEQSRADLVVHDFRPDDLPPEVEAKLRERGVGWLKPNGPASDMPYDVAISYRRKASEPFVKAMHAALTAADFDAYYDQEQPKDETSPVLERRNENTLERIYRFLRRARVLIVVPSEEYFATPTNEKTRSDNTFCPVELADAVLAGIDENDPRSGSHHFWVVAPDGAHVPAGNLGKAIDDLLRKSFEIVAWPRMQSAAGMTSIHTWENKRLSDAVNYLNSPRFQEWSLRTVHGSKQWIVIPATPTDPGAGYDFRGLIKRINEVLRSPHPGRP